MISTHKYILPALVITLFSFTAAFAEKGGNGHGNGHDHFHGSFKNKESRRKKIIIASPDRAIIRHYIAEDYHSHCPPGLAKKHNGCLPPGQAKKHYVIGRPLPEYVVWEPVPQPLLVRLQPIPTGYQYVMLDKDVLLISEASKHVIDAITLISAVDH